MSPSAQTVQTIQPPPNYGEIFQPFRRFKGALVPETLLRGHVTRGAALLYGQLARYSGHDGLCFPGQARVASDFMVAIRTVQRWVSELIRKKLLLAIRRGHGTRSNAYYFLWHPILDPAQLELPLGPPPEPEMPRAKPVQSERKTGWDLRQKCRVNARAFLSEEGQSFLSKRDGRRDFGVNAGGKTPGAGLVRAQDIRASGALLEILPPAERRNEDERPSQPRHEKPENVPETPSNETNPVHVPIEPASVEPNKPQNEPESASEPTTPAPAVTKHPERPRTPERPVSELAMKRRAAGDAYARKYWAHLYRNPAFLQHEPDSSACRETSLFAKSPDNISPGSKIDEPPARAPASETLPDRNTSPPEGA